MHAMYNAATGLDLEPTTSNEATMLDRIAREAVLSRRFILSKKMTPGLGYDDRLEVRLGFKRTTIFKHINSGKLKPSPGDGKIIISERAIRRFEDGIDFIVESQIFDRQAA